MATELEMNAKTQKELESDLTSTKHQLLEIQHNLSMTEKVSDLKKYLNMHRGRYPHDMDLSTQLPLHPTCRFFFQFFPYIIPSLTYEINHCLWVTKFNWENSSANTRHHVYITNAN